MRWLGWWQWVVAGDCDAGVRGERADRWLRQWLGVAVGGSGWGREEI